MKTSQKIIAAALVAIVPLGLFAHDKYNKHHDDDKKNISSYEKMFDRDSKILDEYKDANYEFEGKLEKKPSVGLSGEWLISGIKVIVDDKTFISHGDKKIKVGDEVEIIAKRENGIITALDMEIDD
jgi:hypothetical protein